MDMSKYAESKSNFIKAKDFVGKRLKVKIARVENVHYEASDRGPEKDVAALFFQGKDKGLLLNATNTQTLIDAYGPNSDDWTAHEIGLSTVSYESKGMGYGWLVKPLDIEEPEYEDIDSGAPEGLPAEW